MRESKMSIIRLSAPATLRGEVELPASKSISNRVLVMRSLVRGACPPIENLSDCDDTMVMRRWLEGDDAYVDVGAAGTAMRFSTALLCVRPGEHVITGSARMRQRPIGVLVDALRSLGADIRYEGEEGYPPLLIGGSEKLKVKSEKRQDGLGSEEIKDKREKIKEERGERGRSITLSAGVSSQYISALLMIGPVVEGGLRLQLEGTIVSKPYIDMTVALMREWGAAVEWVDDHTLAVAPRPYQPRAFRVENDWSAASYWYEMVALSTDEEAQVDLPGLWMPSLQGDASVADYFAPLGVRTEQEAWGVRLRKGACQTDTYVLDLVEQPDLAQTLVVTCCMMGVPFRFSGLQSLRIKETDRLTALCTELGKMGFLVEALDGRVLQWSPSSGAVAPRGDVVIDTYDDHRMAMAFAPCCLRTGTIAIRDPHVVTKSYPRFWEQMAKFK